MHPKDESLRRTVFCGLYVAALSMLIVKLLGWDEYALSKLASFTGSNGDNPSAGLLIDAHGNLYGTTRFGGAYGNSNVFKLTVVPKSSSLTFTLLSIVLILISGV